MSQMTPEVLTFFKQYCVLQAREFVERLGLDDVAHAICTMSPLNLLTCPTIRPVSHHFSSDFQVSAATFFENKHGT